MINHMHCLTKSSLVSLSTSSFLSIPSSYYNRNFNRNTNHFNQKQKHTLKLCFSSRNSENNNHQIIHAEENNVSFPKEIKESIINTSSSSSNIPKFDDNKKTNIILLQHVKEQFRPTSTSIILNYDNDNSSNMNDHKNDNDIENFVRNNDIYDIKPYINIETWIWSGRLDNPTIEQKLLSIKNKVHLIWVGNNNSGIKLFDDNNKANKNNSMKNNHNNSNVNYLILDGTWKEAKVMYKKNPYLYSLPRLSLTSSLLHLNNNNNDNISSWKSSSYILRKDYTGWKDKLNNRHNGSILLCTAEVVAALLQINGNYNGCNMILNRLCQFQKDYMKGG